MRPFFRVMGYNLTGLGTEVEKGWSSTAWGTKDSKNMEPKLTKKAAFEGLAEARKTWPVIKYKVVRFSQRDNAENIIQTDVPEPSTYKEPKCPKK